jgi:hypothetical protein
MENEDMIKAERASKIVALPLMISVALQSVANRSSSDMKKPISREANFDFPAGRITIVHEHYFRFV